MVLLMLKIVLDNVEVAWMCQAPYGDEEKPPNIIQGLCASLFEVL
jgi:hypothetical protein